MCSTSLSRTVGSNPNSCIIPADPDFQDRLTTKLVALRGVHKTRGMMRAIV
jgi:hypothetical protein